MKRSILAAILALGVAVPARADITIKSTMAGKGLGLPGSSSTTTSYIKGNKMRIDTEAGDTTRSQVFDVDAQKLYQFDSKRKEADVWDMADFSRQISQNFDTSEMKSSLKPNGQTKQLAGKTASGHDLEVSLPTTMGGKGGMKVTVMLTGPIWIVKGAEGTDEYLAFFKNAVEKGWIFTDPRAAQGQPGQAKAMAEMYRQLAATGGLPYEQEMTIRMQGDGPMAGMLAKMGNMTMTNTVQSIETSAVAADVFAPPTGYKLNQRK